MKSGGTKILRKLGGKTMARTMERKLDTQVSDTEGIAQFFVDCWIEDMDEATRVLDKAGVARSVAIKLLEYAEGRRG